MTPAQAALKTMLEKGGGGGLILLGIVHLVCIDSATGLWTVILMVVKPDYAILLNK